MQTFYDQHPFDGLGDKREAQEAYIPARIHKRLIQSCQGKVVIDVGCGSGNDVGFAARTGVKVVGIDLSLRSLQLMRRRYSQPAVCASNAALPLADGCADVVWSSGVLHHTLRPDLSFSELIRVVKPGGYLYLAVYRSRGRYRVLYTFPGGPLRLLITKCGRIGRFLVHSTALPVYWLAHKIKSRGQRGWAEATNLFYDYFITPTVHFLPSKQILGWAAAGGLLLKAYEKNVGANTHSFIFQRQDAASAEPRPIGLVTVLGKPDSKPLSASTSRRRVDK